MRLGGLRNHEGTHVHKSGPIPDPTRPGISIPDPIPENLIPGVFLQFLICNNRKKCGTFSYLSASDVKTSLVKLVSDKEIDARLVQQEQSEFLVVILECNHQCSFPGLVLKVDVVVELGIEDDIDHVHRRVVCDQFVENSILEYEKM